MTGALIWPKTLNGSDYELFRKRIEQLMTSSRGCDRDSLTQWIELTEETVRDMKSRLKQDIRSLPPSDYVKAKSFLTSLEFELRVASQLPSRAEAIAAG